MTKNICVVVRPAGCNRSKFTFTENDFTFDSTESSFALKPAKRSLVTATPGHCYEVELVAEHYLQTPITEGKQAECIGKFYLSLH